MPCFRSPAWHVVVLRLEVSLLHHGWTPNRTTGGREQGQAKGTGENIVAVHQTHSRFRPCVHTKHLLFSLASSHLLLPPLTPHPLHFSYLVT